MGDYTLKHAILVAIAVAGLIAATWFTVLVAGGTVGPATHLMYLPVLLAATYWGPFGGVATGLAAGLAVSILPVHVALRDVQTVASIAFRTLAYVSVGLLVGTWSQRLHSKQEELARMTLQSIAALVNTVEAKDHYTSGHSIRVASIAVAIGRVLLLDERSLFVLQTGGLLHDVGKVAVSEQILAKPDRLTAVEMEQVMRHPDEGDRILAPFDHQHAERIRDITRHHHERLDGSGYPDRLKGEEISQLAMIVAVADVYDAVTSSRPYRPGMDRVSALLVLHNEVEQGRLDGAVVGILRSLVLTNSLTTRPAATPFHARPQPL